jgi:hypothetical protein
MPAARIPYDITRDSVFSTQIWMIKINKIAPDMMRIALLKVNWVFLFFITFLAITSVTIL